MMPLQHISLYNIPGQSRRRPQSGLLSRVRHFALYKFRKLFLLVKETQPGGSDKILDGSSLDGMLYFGIPLYAKNKTPFYMHSLANGEKVFAIHFLHYATHNLEGFLVLFFCMGSILKSDLHKNGTIWFVTLELTNSVCVQAEQA